MDDMCEAAKKKIFRSEDLFAWHKSKAAAASVDDERKEKRKKGS